MKEELEQTDDAGIKWRVIVDRVTGDFVKIRKTGLPQNPRQPLRFDRQEGRDPSLITIVPNGQGPAEYIAAWLGTHAQPNSEADAQKAARAQFPNASRDEINQAALLYRLKRL